MVTGIIALFSALLISGVAIFFSVAGLAAIFSAYPLSTIIMGSAIELGKLAGVVWLHHNWYRTKMWLKAPLVAMVIGVMFITSMGIFGYLSKSHVEQTNASQENVAQVDRLAQEIARHRAIIARADEKIQSYEDNGSGVDSSINTQIDKEQERLDSAYDRAKPVIQVQLDIIAAEDKKAIVRAKPFRDELDGINETLTNLQTALNNNEIKKAQAMVGTVVDGIYRGNTKQAINDFRERNEKRRNELLTKIDEIKGTPSLAAKAAQEEIVRIRASVQAEIDEGNETIKRLRARLGQSDSNDIELLIDAERAKIKESNVELDKLIPEKFQLETKSRKLEAEVGPIKYIAEFVYGTEPDANLLERAVTWLIIMLIFVFDPFAVFLLIAAQHSFEYYNKKKKPTIEETVSEWEPMPHIMDYEPAEETQPQTEPELDPPELANKEEIAAKEAQLTAEKEDDNLDELMSMYPALNINFDNEVRSGPEFPRGSVIHLGSLFMRSDETPTQLYVANGHEWKRISKDVLGYGAYSHEYIKVLIKRLGNSEYHADLLNEAEKRHIEELLSRDE